MHTQAPRGWDSNFPKFIRAPVKEILDGLGALVPDASPQQVKAWKDSIPSLQAESGEVLRDNHRAESFGTILEYVMPMESRRPDCIFLINGAVVVVELKGKSVASQADIDQVAAYARDLRSYHRDCDSQHVHAVLVPTLKEDQSSDAQGVTICGPHDLDRLLNRLERPEHVATPLHQFLDQEAYRPLPTLVAAARELLQTGSLRRIRRASAATDPTVEAVKEIALLAARTKTRHLVLITGVPGAGKTLVGLQTVHAHWLDELAVSRGDGKPSAPAVFLSGNGPLVEVLQYELRSAGGGGKTFVRGVKDYVQRYSSRTSATPPEHVLVFDEAQRAYNREMVALKHRVPLADARSEPEHFIEFAARIPEWCVVVGLIGGGQEIHKGEEAGLKQWRSAVEECAQPGEWTVHCPPKTSSIFAGSPIPTRTNARLNLDTELRFHLVRDVHKLVARMLDGVPPEECRSLARSLDDSGYHLRLTRSLNTGRAYLWERYQDAPDKRFGLLASSRDKCLERHGVPNDFQSTKKVKFGPWYGDAQDDSKELSGRLLRDCVTEFGAQGLELDAALVAWGSDFRRRQQVWSSSDARKYLQDQVPVLDPHQLRLNSYRVLLTRAREAVVIFVPPDPAMNETAEYLLACGIHPLATSPATS